MDDYLPQGHPDGRAGPSGHEANTLRVQDSDRSRAPCSSPWSFWSRSCSALVMKGFSQEEKELRALAPPRFAGDVGPVPGPRLQAEPVRRAGPDEAAKSSAA